MQPDPVNSPTPWLRRAQQGFRGLSPRGRVAVAAVAAVPLFAMAALGASLFDGEPSTGAAPAMSASAASGGGGDTFLHGATGILSQDLERALEDIGEAGPAADYVAIAAADPEYTARAIELMQSLPKDADGNPDWSRIDMDDYGKKVAALGAPGGDGGSAPAAPIEVDELDLDEALEQLVAQVEAASPDDDVLDAIRDSEQGENPGLLIAHSFPLMAAGDVWGAAANLIVAHEQDEDDATPLVNLAAIANSQNLPAVTLALLEAAEALEIGDDDSPVGMREQAALLNNRGHALALLRRYEDAEAPLRQALAMNPELSEAARNLVHVLLKQGKREEAQALVPRALWRLRGDPAKPVPTQDTENGKVPAQVPPAAGSPEQIAKWVKSPFLELSQGQARLPLWIALDLSKQGQTAWPEPIYPKADASYGLYFPTASARYVASHEAARAFGEQTAGPIGAMLGRRMSLGQVIQQIIQTRISPEWALEPIDTEMHRLKGDRESLILSGNQQTRFQALSVARAEYRMEEEADRLYERYGKAAVCPVNSDTAACCAIHRREINRNIGDMTPFARDYEEQMRVFFRDAYGLSTAIASNLPEGGWHDVARIDIEQQIQSHHARTQQEIAFAFSHAAPYGGGCYGSIPDVDGAAPDVAVDAPACSAASQWGSGKWAISDAISVELTCGKLKFVAEVNVIGTKKLKWGPLKELGADLGMHAEIEFSMEGTVTIFAGPKAGISGKIGDFGGDFGVKDGIYAVIGKDGVQDVGMRVVVGGGVGAGPLGGTHDVDTMDFSFVSAL